MKKNVLWWDRWLRFLLGVFMVAWAIAGGSLFTEASLGITVL